jgi:hypothetical protein
MRNARRDAMRDATSDHHAPSAELVHLMGRVRVLVVSYVRWRRAAGAPVERVLPEIEGLVRQAAASEGWLDPAESLAAEVVRWSIEAYHDAPAPLGAARLC